MSTDLFDQEVLAVATTDDDCADDDTGDWAQSDCTLTFSTDHYVQTVTAANTVYFADTNALTVGKIYNIKFDYYIPSTNTNVDEVSLRSDSVSTIIIQELIVTDTWTSVETNYLCPSTSQDNLYFFLLQSNSKNGLNIGDTARFRNILVSEVTTPHKGTYSWPYLGGAELITDTTLATDILTKGTGWTHDAVDDEYDCDASQVADSDLTENVVTAAGLYRNSFLVDNYVAGNVAGLVDTTEGTDVASDGTKTQYIYADSAGVAGVRGDVDFDGSIETLSVRPVQTSWAPSSTNLLSIDETNQKLTITGNGSDDKGATLALSDAADLSEDLEIGSDYIVTIFGAEATNGDIDIEVAESDDTELDSVTIVDGAAAADVTLEFTATHATTNKLQLDNLANTEILKFSSITISAVGGSENKGLHYLGMRLK